MVELKIITDISQNSGRKKIGDYPLRKNFKNMASQAANLGIAGMLATQQQLGVGGERGDGGSGNGVD